MNRRLLTRRVLLEGRVSTRRFYQCDSRGSVGFLYESAIFEAVSLEPIETDVVVVGAGPVGLFAIFQCCMVSSRCHVMDVLWEIGGQCTALYPDKPIYDIPGFPKILARDLIENLHQQIRPFYPSFHLNQQVISATLAQDNFHWHIKTSQGLTLRAKAVVLAAGGGAFGPNRPPLEGLAIYEGRSVFYP